MAIPKTQKPESSILKWALAEQGFLDAARPSRTFSTGQIGRRQVVKTSLIGLGSLAAATGMLAPLDSLAATPSRSGRWRQLFPTSAPSPRGGAAMAYDAARAKIVLFGGTWKDADTWTWDGRTWNHMSPPVSPPARSDASLAYHPATKTLVLFGGGSATGFLGDTWLWNGITWTAVPGDGPPARGSASMAFDPASGSLILFGGARPEVFDDTWMWNGKSWVRLSPRSSPPGRFGTSFAYHSGMGRLILFGGKRSAMGVPEPEATWAWDGKDWSQLSLGRLPPWRFGASMAAAGGGVLLFGGISMVLGPSNGSYLGDTWMLGRTWSQVTQTPAPPPRAGAGLVPYPSRNSLLLFGGGFNPGYRQLRDTWVWELS